MLMKLLVFISLLVGIATIKGCGNTSSKTLSKESHLLQFSWTDFKNLDEKEVEKKISLLSINYGRELKVKMSERNIPLIVGEIDQKFLDSFHDIANSNKTIAISSSGGLAYIAFEIATIISAQDINIIIVGACHSACAEIILPAAKSIEFYNSPLIGYHGNMVSMRYYIDQGLANPCVSSSNRDNFSATLSKLVNQTKALYEQTGHNIDFWKEQVNRLGDPKIVKRQIGGYNCSPSQRFAYKYWFPTTHQLKTMLGLKFKGNLCSDNQNCYTKKIPLVEGFGEKYIIGNNPYISALPEY